MTLNGESTQDYSKEEVQQKLHFGDLAQQAFQNPLFLTWYQLMLQKTINAIDAAAPDHSKAVMYQKCKREVLAEMAMDFQTIIGEAQKLIAEQQQQNSPEYQEKQRLDTQGFGLNFNQ